MAWTQTQITNLNNSMSAAQDVGLGTLLSGGVVNANVTAVSTLRYSVAPTLQTATSAMPATLLLVAAQTAVTAGIIQPDVPRIITVKGNGANVTGNVVIRGTNINDVAITDTIASNGATEVLGVKAFKTITSVDLPAYAVAGTESISLGRGVKIGFPVAIPNTGNVISKNFNGSVDAGTVTAATTVEGSIYSVAGTMDGAKIVALTFVA
jgi:hypothetical protein